MRMTLRPMCSSANGFICIYNMYSYFVYISCIYTVYIYMHIDIYIHTYIYAFRTYIMHVYFMCTVHAADALAHVLICNESCVCMYIF